MRLAATALIATAGLWLAGCESTPSNKAAAATPAPAVTPLQEYLQQAARAAAAGNREGARDAYRQAAKAYPANKEPWIKLAEDYFSAADYGNAVLASQEVLQRDGKDNVAASILAVSGLRISTSALTLLREQNNIGAGTRSEAESLARTLRGVIGEPELVPRPSEPAPKPQRPRTPRPPAAKPAPAPAVVAPAAAPAVNPAAATAAPTAAPKPAPAVRPPAPPPANPFDQLK